MIQIGDCVYIGNEEPESNLPSGYSWSEVTAYDDILKSRRKFVRGGKTINSYTFAMYADDEAWLESHGE
jgi:hypothetical protein